MNKDRLDCMTLAEKFIIGEFSEDEVYRYTGKDGETLDRFRNAIDDLNRVSKKKGKSINKGSGLLSQIQAGTGTINTVNVTLDEFRRAIQQADNSQNITGNFTSTGVPTSHWVNTIIADNDL